MVKIIIAGCRHYENYDFVKMKCDYLLGNIEDTIEIVSGRCNTGEHTFTTHDGIKVFGVDGLGERYAQERNIPIKAFPANWSSFGNAAGPIRNKEMAKYSDNLIAFWNQISIGTRDMIAIATFYNLKIKTIKI